jgi:hypothetical protein
LTIAVRFSCVSGAKAAQEPRHATPASKWLRASRVYIRRSSLLGTVTRETSILLSVSFREPADESKQRQQQ